MCRKFDLRIGEIPNRTRVPSRSLLQYLHIVRHLYDDDDHRLVEYTNHTNDDFVLNSMNRILVLIIVITDHEFVECRSNDSTTFHWRNQSLTW